MKLKKDWTKEEKQEFDEIIRECKEKDIPGPNVYEHDEKYDGPCFCQTCLSYG